uniref:Uncharacterized protein n=1 Tax=Anguilla anguilla TaxID=7936 RepID=A0A0E9VM26_ANGAN
MWSKSIPVPAITRALDTMGEVLLFFSSDPALEKQLDLVIAEGLRESYEKVQELQGKFCSVWLEKHDSYEVFCADVGTFSCVFGQNQEQQATALESQYP